MPETETDIPIHVNERTRRAAEATLHALGLTPSQFFSLLLVGIAHDESFAASMVKYANSFGPLPIIPNAETIEAMEAAERGELSGPFSSVDELMKHLHDAKD
jgi:DNA-damage-inducible protein J